MIFSPALFAAYFIAVLNLDINYADSSWFQTSLNQFKGTVKETQYKPVEMDFRKNFNSISIYKVLYVRFTRVPLKSLFGHKWILIKN